MRFRDRFKLAIYRQPTPEGDIFVDASGAPVNLVTAPSGGTGGGGGTSSGLDATAVQTIVDEAISALPAPVTDTGLDATAVQTLVDQAIAAIPAPSGGAASAELGIVVPVDGLTSKTLTNLPAGDEYEIKFDGVLQLANPPAPAGAVSWAYDGAHGGMFMLVNSRGDGKLAHQVVPSYFNAVPKTQQEWLDWTGVTYPNSVAQFMYDGATAGPNYYHLVTWGNIFGGTPAGWSNDTFAAFNAALVAFGFSPWPDTAHPGRADVERPVNITVRPNGVIANTQSLVGGSDGVQSENAKVNNKGLVIGRAVSGFDWRVFGRSNLVVKSGAKRVAAGQSVAVQGDKRRAFVLGGTWDENVAPVDNLVVDFDGAAFTGTVSVVPKAVIAA